MWTFVAPPPEPGLEPGPTPTFSVVIAAYQAAATVGEAVRSALDQTVPPREVIVVDDGSTDEVECALAAYRDRVVFLRQPNRGSAAAKNAGGRAASGDFVAILDADDVFLPGRLEALGELAASRPDLDLVMSDVSFEVDGATAGTFCATTPFETVDQRTAILSRCFVVAPAARRTTLLDVGGFDESLSWGADWQCWIKIIMAGGRVGLVAESLYRYSIVEGSLSSARARTLLARVDILEDASVRYELSHHERAALTHSLSEYRREAMLARAETSLRRRDPSGRRDAFAVAMGRGIGVPTRLKAVAAALAPGMAARRLDEAEARTGGSRLHRSYPRE